MKTYSAQELYNLLIQADESVWIEAKGHGDTNQYLFARSATSLDWVEAIFSMVFMKIKKQQVESALL